MPLSQPCLAELAGLQVWSTLVLVPRRPCGCSCGLECPWCRPGEPVGAVAAWSASGCFGGLECHWCRPGEPVGAGAAWRAGWCSWRARAFVVLDCSAGAGAGGCRPVLFFGCTFSAIRQVEGSSRNLVGLLRHRLVVLAQAADEHCLNHHFYGTAVDHVLVAGAFGVGAVEGVCFNPEVAFGMNFVSIYLDLAALLAAAAGKFLVRAAGVGAGSWMGGNGFALASVSLRKELRLHAAGLFAEMLYFNGPSHQFVLVFMLLSMVLPSFAALLRCHCEGAWRLVFGSCCCATAAASREAVGEEPEGLQPAEPGNARQHQGCRCKCRSLVQLAPCSQDLSGCGPCPGALGYGGGHPQRSQEARLRGCGGGRQLLPVRCPLPARPRSADSSTAGG